MASDVLKMLEQDHQQVDAMLKSLADTEPGAERERLMHELEKALSVHMQFEEEHLYPVVQELDAEMAEEADIEHNLAREGLAKMTELVSQPGFGAAVEMLTGGITHHVEEEEDEIFPKLREGVDADRLESLGHTLSEQKQAVGLAEPSDATKEELLERARELGIEGRSNMTKDELEAAIAASGA